VKTSSSEVVATSLPYLTIHRRIAGDIPIYLKICDTSDPPYENSAFSVIAGLPTKANKPRPTKFCYMLEGLRALLSTIKILGKFVPKKFRTQPKLKFLANAFFATSSFDTAYIGNETSHRQTKMLVSIYNVSHTRRPTFRDL